MSVMRMIKIHSSRGLLNKYLDVIFAFGANIISIYLFTFNCSYYNSLTLKLLAYNMRPNVKNEK